ncbi:MAK10-like protein [Tanacetum coccineum]
MHAAKPIIPLRNITTNQDVQLPPFGEKGPQIFSQIRETRVCRKDTIASNWLERLPAGSITAWEDLTTHFFAQFFPPGRTVKFRNDILMFQQHQGESLSEAWTPGGKLHDRNAEESWALLEDLTLYDNKSWNNPRDFAKPVKEDEAKEEGNVKARITEYEDHEMTVESEKEFEEETEDEIKEEEEDSPKHFDTFPTMKDLRSLVYDKEEGTITFEKDKEKIVFKMPHKMEMFKHMDFTDIRTDWIPPFAIESDDDSSRKLTTLIA